MSRFDPSGITRSTYMSITGLPDPHPWVGAVVLQAFGQRIVRPLFSFVIPVFNKADILNEVLDRLMAVVPEQSQFVFINDASTDETHALLTHRLRQANCDALLLTNETPLYETACHNLGAALSTGRYVCDFQSDLRLHDATFFARVERVFAHGGISSLSGRAGHSWDLLLSLPWHRRPLKPSRYQVGLTGTQVFQRPARVDTTCFWHVDTNCRGPWVLDTQCPHYGLLDSTQFFLGDDDHHYNFSRQKYGLRAAYLPCDVYCLPQDGSTRQARTGQNQLIFDFLSINKSGSDRLLGRLCSLPLQPVARIKL